LAAAAAAACLRATAAACAGVVMSTLARQGWFTALRSSIITLRRRTTDLDLSAGAKHRRGEAGHAPVGHVCRRGQW
jgi:hypothetical protein